jgi:hypothetical protein
LEKTGGLFTEYVNTFLKIKQESAGYPEWVTKEQDKLNYISDYNKHERIVLDYDKIIPWKYLIKIIFILLKGIVYILGSMTRLS